MMISLVTGVAGFIGSHLAEALIKEGHRVVGVDCFTDYYPRSVKVSNIAKLRKTKNFRFVNIDLSTANLSPLVRDWEYIFHLAAQPGVRASWGPSFTPYVNDNIIATGRLLEAVKQQSIEKFVYSSSSSVYGDSESLPTPEKAPPRPISPYGVTKLAAENLCNVYIRNYSLPVVVLRYFTVYGPRQRPDMAFSTFISKIASGKELVLFGDGRQKRDFTFVGDTVSATISATRAPPGAIYNVGTGISTTLDDVISTIESILGRKAKVTRKSVALGDVRNTSADITRIRRELSYSPTVSLAEGLRRQVAAHLHREM